MAAWWVLERTASARADADNAGNAGSSEAAAQESLGRSPGMVIKQG